MAAIAAAVGSIQSTANQLGVYASAAPFTPVQNDLLVVVASFTATVDNTCSCAESAGGGTYTQVAVKEYEGTGSRLFAWVRTALVPASPASRSIQLNLPVDAATGCNATVLRVTGMSLAGASAVKQSAVNKNSAATTPTVTFGASCLTTNPVLLYTANGASPNGLTEPAAPFDTEFVALAFITPASGAQVVKTDSGFTGTTITYGAASATAWGIIALELDASAAAVTMPPKPLRIQQAVNRSYTY